jgi:polyhydroxyalkanoate synthase
LRSLEEMMSEVGYLDSSRMSAVFNMMRARDLIWPYVVNNYMLGKKPPPFDLLFWNADSTRMAAANHAFYLHEFYKANKLSKGELVLGGVKLDLSKITIPIFQMAAREDHIAPADSVFKGSRLFGGKVRFVLAGSGHIAGVVNPPAKPKYQHWTGPKEAESLDDWLAQAEEHPGSWWPHWIKWLAKRSGDEVSARQPGHGALEAIEDAPGSYVKAKHA